jgi:hypothetical protein
MAIGLTIHKIKYVLALLFIGLAIIIYSCKSKNNSYIIDDHDYLPHYGTLKLHLETKINGNKVILNSVKYLNTNLDTFTVSRLKYYVSNIRLKKSDNTYYTIPESYYLIDASVSNDTMITIPNVPLGTYTEAAISIGVDAGRNHTGAQTGALDPTIASDMFWTWSTGYRFLLLEGTYRTASSAGYNGLVFHISDDINFKTTTLNSASAAWTDINIRESKTTELHLDANIDEMFKTPNTIQFAVTNNVSGGPEANSIADNYADMLGLVGIINE